MSCAVLESSGEFGLAPYLEMLVLGMLVIWQSFMLYHKSEQFVVSWSIAAGLLRHDYEAIKKTN